MGRPGRKPRGGVARGWSGLAYGFSAMSMAVPGGSVAPQRARRLFFVAEPFTAPPELFRAAATFVAPGSGFADAPTRFAAAGFFFAVSVGADVAIGVPAASAAGEAGANASTRSMNLPRSPPGP